MVLACSIFFVNNQNTVHICIWQKLFDESQRAEISSHYLCKHDESKTNAFQTLTVVQKCT